MRSIDQLLNPASIAVIGASQTRGRGKRVIENLQDLKYAGEIYAIHPHYEDVLGVACYPSVTRLPKKVDCVVAAVSADAACQTLEEACGMGVRAAVVLGAGFGEGGHGADRVARLRALSREGMSICGPNCYGALNVRTGAAAFSGAVQKPLRPGRVALVSQSGGLGANAFNPLMGERHLGFSHFISCGNQLVTYIEDYLEAFLDDPEIDVIALVVESLKNPEKFYRCARLAHRKHKTVIVFHAGRTAAGQIMTQSHTGALAGDRDIMAAFWRRCGVVAPENYDEFVETIALLAVVPRDRIPDPEVIVVSGSGGGAAVVADSLDGSDLKLARLNESIQSDLASILPDFGSITNPVDGTGAMSDNPKLLPSLYEALLKNGGNSILATTVAAWPAGRANSKRFASILADAASKTQRVVVAYQPSPLGGPLDGDVVDVLHGSGVPLLLGIPNAMRALRHIARRAEWRGPEPEISFAMSPPHMKRDFMSLRESLVAAGVNVSEAALAHDEEEAVRAAQAFSCPVAIKAEVPGLLHKSDVGCVRLGLSGDAPIREAYREVVGNARKAGFAEARHVILQPMHKGIVEAYAGIIHDPLFGSLVTFGIGGVFIEIFRDVTMELVPLDAATARQMVDRIRAAPLLMGARGSRLGDRKALVDLLLALSRFAVATRGSYHVLELNPIMVKAEGEGVVAVDIAVD